MTSSRLLPATILGTSALLLGACNGNIDISFDHDEVSGSGTITTQTYDVSDFDSITICCDLDIQIEIASGSDAGVAVTTDDNLQQLLKVEVKGDTLSIRPKSNDDHLNSTGQIVISIPDYEVTDLKVSSASSVTGEFSVVEDFSLRASEAARVNIGVDTDNLMVRASSASDVTIAGRGTTLDVDVNSAASVDLDEVKVEDASVEATSASSLEVTVTGSIDGTVSSGAAVQVSGEPSSISVQTSSGGSLDTL